jgi:hypothetical protein
MALYDFSYIDDKIIGGVEKNLPNVADILKKVELRATGKAVSSISMSEAAGLGNEQTRFGETGGLSSTGDDQPKPKKITE